MQMLKLCDLQGEMEGGRELAGSDYSLTCDAFTAYLCTNGCGCSFPAASHEEGGAGGGGGLKELWLSSNGCHVTFHGVTLSAVVVFRIFGDVEHQITPNTLNNAK